MLTSGWQPHLPPEVGRPSGPAEQPHLLRGPGDAFRRLIRWISVLWNRLLTAPYGDRASNG
jgi:hypothetical protein